MSPDDLAALVTTIARIPAPTFAEEERLRWIARQLEGAPGARTVDMAGNLVWRWGDDRPRVLLLTHVDTVFPAGTLLDFHVDGGELVGPGCGDNAAAIAVTIQVVRRLLEDGALLPGAVAFTVGEEGLGNLRGATEACRTLAPDAAIAVEGHGLDRVIVDAVGSVRARIEVTGPGGHSWDDRGLPSATHALISLAVQLLGLASEETPVNIGLIAGGRSVNTIADQAELTVEMRGLEESSLDAFVVVLGQLEVGAPLALRLEIVGRRPSGRLDRASPLLAAVLAIRRDLGLPETLAAGSTDANAAIAAGIPAISIGVAEGTAMHSINERIAIATLATGAAQLEALTRRLLAR